MQYKDVTITMNKAFDADKVQVTLTRQSPIGLICAKEPSVRTDAALTLLSNMDGMDCQRVWVSASTEGVQQKYPDLVDLEACVLSQNSFDIEDITDGAFVVFDNMFLSKEQVRTVFVDKGCKGIVAYSDNAFLHIMDPRIDLNFALMGKGMFDRYIDHAKNMKDVERQSHIMSTVWLSQAQSKRNLILTMPQGGEIVPCRFQKPEPYTSR